MLLPFIIILLVVLPTAWLICEFRSPRWIRIILGVSSLALSFVVAWGVGLISQFNYNAWYGGASSRLIDTVILNVESGNQDALLRELRQLKTDYHPTYENRARYDELVDQFVERLKLSSSKDPAAKPTSTKNPP
ncbi:MAG: hypothetical protein K8T25_24675 [Planctomycetia bacterium]|nr:hypothetical protein [Planctomycetia bacterium]